MFDIEEELKKLPAKPGVYIMHDKSDAIIYVGKAVSLKNRVRQYFQNTRNLTPKISQMVAHIDHFEYIVVDSEIEALVLECNLIKEHRPKYNTMLKDDKEYPYIKVTINETFPRVLIARKQKKDGAKYFGPYPNGSAVKDSLELLRKLYYIRTCNRNLPKEIGSERPCLYYHIKQCKAPCQGYITKEEYQKSIEQVMEFLNGNYEIVAEQLRQKMQKASEDLAFEEAAEYRDLLESVQKLSQKQKASDTNSIDRDIIAFVTAQEEAVVQVFFIREGKMLGREHFYLNGIEKEKRSAIMANFIKQFYSGTPYIPKELLLSEEPEELVLLEEWLSMKRGTKVYLHVPKKGEKEQLVELAKKNASMVLQKDSEKIKREEARTFGAMREISGWLHLENLQRIEAYDISNISGFESVGSMVVYENGKAKKADYRKFRIQSVKGSNDYASMYEVLTRRFVHAKKESEELLKKNMDFKFGSFTRYPDLILMDGGRGQVNIALQVLSELKLAIPVCGMVKDESHKTRGLYFNNIEIPIDTHSEGFRLITRIQDETHRFAIEYHRSLHNKTQIKSILDEIEGIGPTRRRALMKHFLSLEAIRNATIEELVQISEMNRSAAEAVYHFFHP